MDRMIFALGLGVFAVIVMAIALTVIEFRRLERDKPPRDPRFPL
jgi:hypothetical protein